MSLPACLTRFAALTIAVCATVGAQDIYDPFSYSAGTTIPGYTEQRGNWTSNGSQVQGQAGVTFQELTLNGVNDADECVEVTAVYNTLLPGLQYAGPVARYSGAGPTATYFMVKVQDNATPYTGFDTIYAYFYNGSTFSSFGFPVTTIAVPTTMARVRLQVRNVAGSVKVEAFVDSNMDGLWDYTGTATTTLGLATSGTIGATVYQSSLIDDLRYFAANLSLVGTPTIGTTVTLQGSSVPNFTYLGAMSLGHTGVPLGGGKIVPLDLDSIFDYSFASINFPTVFQDFAGVAQADGSFVMTLNIPVVPALSGASLYAAAVSWDGYQVVEVTPDVQVKFI